MMKKSELTVFLSLVFVLLIAFILGILEISVIHTSKNLSRLEADRAVFSLFGEYQKKLLENYHIFAVEGSYGTGIFQENNLIDRIHYYDNSRNDYEILGIQYLTDSSGQAFQEQAVEYMEKRYGISLIKALIGKTGQWREEEIQGEEISEIQEEVFYEYEKIKEEGEKIKAEENGTFESEEQPETQNLFSFFEKIKKSGLLSIVLPENMELSERKIELKKQASNRKLRSGSGKFPVRQGINGVEERLLFNEFILKNFNIAQTEQNVQEKEKKKDPSLLYEVEYIIGGKNSDKENLESILMKLFFIRTALNYTSLLGDSVRQSQAAVLAASISSVLFMPEASEIVKQAILFAWASGESIVDLRTLLSGRRTALIKNSENWQLSLSHLFTLGTEQFIGDDVPEGISYEEYLRIFLFLEDPDEVAMRTIDRIEENMRMLYGTEIFQADQCITKIKIKSTTKIFGNITYTFPVYFGYE